VVSDSTTFARQFVDWSPGENPSRIAAQLAERLGAVARGEDQDAFARLPEASPPPEQWSQVRVTVPNSETCSRLMAEYQTTGSLFPSNSDASLCNASDVLFEELWWPFLYGQLAAARIGGDCLPLSPLRPGGAPRTTCRVFEGFDPADGRGDCAGRGLVPVGHDLRGGEERATLEAAVRARWDAEMRLELDCFSDEFMSLCAEPLLCELPEYTDGLLLDLCECSLEDDERDAPSGFCLIDASEPTGRIGNPEFVARCPDGARRALRFREPPTRGGVVHFVQCEFAPESNDVGSAGGAEAAGGAYPD